MTLIKQRLSSFIFLNNVCYPATDTQGVYINMFAWLKGAQYVGKVEVAGVECDAWERPLGQNLSYYLALANESVPILYNATDGDQSAFSYFFLSFEAGAAGADELFAVTTNVTECFDPPTCEEDASIVEMDAYIFHPEDSFDVADQNVGDVRVSPVFVCHGAHLTAACLLRW